MRGSPSDESHREEIVSIPDSEIARNRHVRRKRRLFIPANEWEYAYLKDLSSLERIDKSEDAG